LNQWNHFFEGKYINDLSENKTLIGIQQTITDNIPKQESTAYSPISEAQTTFWNLSVK
jgi:hypothetical protein